MADAMKVSDFMLNLKTRLVAERNIADSTATQYLQTLYKLAGGKFNNMAWAKKYEEVEEKLKEYAPSTRQSYMAALASSLSLFNDKPVYKKAYRYWRDKMATAGEELRKDAAKHEKSETQEENWITWDEVEKKKSGLKEDVLRFHSNKKVSEGEYEILLHYLILSLYTDIAPRRNQDYLDMYVVKKLPKEYERDKNYYDVGAQQFVFNKYKTAKTYGEQRIAVPESLQEALSMYMKFHPLKKQKEFKLLVKADGEALNSVNAITRILNRIFDKKVGSSMLRHIYLSSRYQHTDKERDATALEMAHSREMQRLYIKKDSEDE